jgi:hypothetical protein
MPATPWDEIRGHRCDLCQRWATHFYGAMALCCECHAGPGQGLVSQEEAARMQTPEEPGDEEPGDG